MDNTDIIRTPADHSPRCGASPRGAAALAEVDRTGDPEIGTADFERLDGRQCHQCGRRWATAEDADEDAEMWACVSPIGLFDHHGFGDPDPGTVERDMPITTVAIFLSVSEAYVLKALKDAALPSHDVGGEKRIRLRDVWAIKQRQDAQSEAA